MAKWAYLATAPNQVVAEMWQEMLKQEGIPAMLQPGDVMSFIGVSGQPMRVLVAEDKLDAAKQLLAEVLESEDTGEEEEETDENDESQGR